MNAIEMKQRTKEFAHRCVKLACALDKDQLSYHMRGQFIRCSTSVAANYRSSCIAQSKKSFVAKLSIALEEADESNFWLKFIMNKNLVKPDRVAPLLKESAGLTSILIASRKTAESKMKKKKYTILKQKLTGKDQLNKENFKESIIRTT